MQLLGPRVLHQQLVPKRNGVHILLSCRAFQVQRGCIAQINLKDREGSELKLIHSLLCHLGSCERDTLYQEHGRLCNLKEGGHHFSSGRAVGALTRPSFNCTNSSPPNEMVSTFFRVLSFRLMRARHPLSRTWKALQLERRWTSFFFGTGCWCTYSALV